MKRIFLQLLLLSFASLSFAQNRTLLEIDGQKIDAEEFKHIFKKNYNHSGEVTRKDVDEYLKLFIDFKLKVYEGEQRERDTALSFRQEMHGYRKQLAQPYLSDKRVEEELIKEAYDRMCYDINVSHILIKVAVNDSPEDTLKAWNKVNAIYKEALEGKDFETLAVNNSEDPSVVKNKGNLGYCTVFGLVYDFENVMYNTEVGKVSAPFRTKYGYHIIKVNDKRPSKGKYKVAHIMIASPQDATDQQKKEAEDTIKSVYRQLKECANFEQLALKYSVDRKTAMNKGVIGWITVGGRMIKEFETAAFNLNEIGEYSDIVRTSYGYHIIKLVDKEPLKSFDECKAEIKSTISTSLRSHKGRDMIIAKLREEYNIKENQKQIDKFCKKYITDSIFNGTWAIDSSWVLTKPILTIKDKQYTELDFARFMRVYNHKQPPVDKKMLVNNAYKAFCNKYIIEYEELHLEEKYPTFRYLLKEYHDGILLFALTSECVWNKAITDTTGLEAFYNTVKDKYQWGYRYNVKSFVCKDAKTADQLTKALSQDFDNTAFLNEANAKDSASITLKETALNEKGQNVLVDNALMESGIEETANLVKAYNKGNIVTAIKVVAPCQKELNEIKGIVTAAYQDYLEVEWLKSLHSKYNVVVNEGILDQIVTELNN